MGLQTGAASVGARHPVLRLGLAGIRVAVSARPPAIPVLGLAGVAGVADGACGAGVATCYECGLAVLPASLAVPEPNCSGKVPAVTLASLRGPSKTRTRGSQQGEYRVAYAHT